jgi:putative heme transporter
MDEPNSEPPPKLIRVDLTVRSAFIALGTVAAVWLLLQLWQVLLVIVVALVFVGMLNPFVEGLERRKLKRGYAIGIVFGTLFAAVGGLAALAIPRLASQVSDLVQNFPASQERLATQLGESRMTAPLGGWVRSLEPAVLLQRAKEYGLDYGPKAIEIVAYGLSAFFLAVYIIVDRDRMRGTLFSLVPRGFHVRLSRVLVNLETIVGGYMRGQAITSALMAGFMFVVLLIAGVPNALALALFAGVADVLPYVGALLVCVPAFLAALSQGTTVAFVVLALVAAYQEIESRFIVPRIYGDVLRLPAAMVMVSLLVGGKLLGILGALLALPIAAGIRMVIEELRVSLPGEHVDNAALVAKDAVAEAQFEALTVGVPACEAAAIAVAIAVERREEEAAEDLAAPDVSDDVERQPS